MAIREFPSNLQALRATATGATAAQLFRRSARIFRDRIAVTAGEQALTYGQLDERSTRLANALSGFGLGRNDTLGVVSENRIEYVETLVAAAKIGATVVSLNVRLLPADMAHCLNDSGARLLMVSKGLLPAAEALRSLCPEIATFVCFDAAQGYDSYEGFLAQGSSIPPREDLVQSGDIHTVVYTSGTTGKSKGAMLSQLCSTSRAHNIAAWLELGPDDGFVGWAPLYHIGGYEHLYAVLAVGGKFANLPRAAPELLCEAIERWKLTYTLMLPGVITDFLRVARTTPHDLDSLRVCAGYANLLSSQVHLEFAEVMDIPFHDIFGQTETSYVATGPIDAKAGKFNNKTAMPYMDVRLLDDDLNEVPDGSPGEFVLRGPNVCAGYLNNPQATAELFRGGWLHTGDVLVRNPDGTFLFADRKKYLIKTGAENVYPAEVEQILAQHEAVQEVCVIGIPDEKWGETVKAFVVLRAGKQLTLQEVSEWCRPRMAGYKKPRFVEFIQDSDLPRSVTGKIMREPLGKRPTTETQRVEAKATVEE